MVTLSADAGKAVRANGGKGRLPMARRHFQTGCLAKKGASWVFRYREYEIRADRTQVTVHKSVSFGPVSRSQAIELRDEVVRRRGLRERTRPKAGMTVDEFWTRHFEPHVVEKERTNTRKMHQGLYRRHVKIHFESKKLYDVGTYEIQEFVSLKQAEGLSVQTLVHLRAVLSKMLGTAVLWGWLDRNPARGVKLPRMERTRKPRILTFEEISKLECHLREPARTILALGVRLGLRIGELLGLKVEDVDFESGNLFIRRSATRGEVGPTKTKGSERQFPLTDQTTALLRGYLARREVRSEWLFPTMKGGFHNDRTLFTRYVAPVIAKLEMKHFSWHSMRHTFLTNNGNDGVAMPVLQSLAGHTNARTTLGYIVTFAEQKRTALERWEEKLQAARPQVAPITPGSRMVN